MRNNWGQHKWQDSAFRLGGRGRGGGGKLGGGVGWGRVVLTIGRATPYEQYSSQISLAVPRVSVCVLKPNSWTYNFVEVSGHNLESSQTWDFRIQCLHYKPVWKPTLLNREGEYNLLVLVLLCVKVEWFSGINCYTIQFVSRVDCK
jgi:hypothetical protein